MDLTLIWCMMNLTRIRYLITTIVISRHLAVQGLKHHRIKLYTEQCRNLCSHAHTIIIWVDKQAALVSSIAPANINRICFKTQWMAGHDIMVLEEIHIHHPAIVNAHLCITNITENSPLQTHDCFSCDLIYSINDSISKHFGGWCTGDVDKILVLFCWQ